MIRRFKTFLVNLLPRRLSLPVRYLYNQLTSRLEPEVALLPLLVKRGTRVVDVGANIGFYGYALSRLGVQVECFEPVPGCAGVIRDYGARNIAVHGIGLSDAPGQAQLIVPHYKGRLVTARSHLGRAEEQRGTQDAVVDIELRTLDSYGFRDVSFIKIDVEGHELGVLAGARETILACRPALLVEIEQRHLPPGKDIADTFAYVQALGYSGSFLRDGVETPLASFDLQQDQLGRIAHLEATGDDRGYVNNFIFRPTA